MNRNFQPFVFFEGLRERRFIKMIRTILFSICLLLFNCEDKNDSDDLQSQNFILFEEAQQFTDPFSLNEVALEGRELTVNVSYGGGCAEHQFTLVWPDAILTIHPAQFDIYLVHDANGDMCEAYPSEILVFNLSENPLGLSLEALKEAKMGIVNASNPEQVFYTNP